MTKVKFYFDPSCPWCWITSRWLTVVKEERDIEIEWLPFSLAIKNNELDGEGDSPYPEMHRASHRVLRVIEDIADKEKADRGDLYTAFAKTHFIDKRDYSDEAITKVLRDLDYSEDYANVADSKERDEDLQEHMSNALEIVGNNVGVPLIIFVDESGNQNGYFGPVLTELPEKEEALKLWDGLSSLASSSKFLELKRTRTIGPAVDSTAKLFD